MQTFLPFPSYVRSARCLDNRRLSNQRNECMVIFNALQQGPTCVYEKPRGRQKKGSYRYDLHQSIVVDRPDRYMIRKTPWFNHPAVRMWWGGQFQLLLYGKIVCTECITRSIQDSLFQFFDYHIRRYTTENEPPWLGNRRLHHSHKLNLLYKQPDYYYRFFSHLQVPAEKPENYWPC